MKDSKAGKRLVRESYLWIGSIGVTGLLAYLRVESGINLRDPNQTRELGVYVLLFLGVSIYGLNLRKRAIEHNNRNRN